MNSVDSWLQVSVCSESAQGTEVPLVVSGLVPLADLLPELMQRVRPEPPPQWRSGTAVHLCDGTVLHWNQSLLDQRVTNGEVLILAATAPMSAREDDVTRAVAVAVASSRRTSTQGRRVLAAAAAGLTLLGGAVIVMAEQTWVGATLLMALAGLLTSLVITANGRASKVPVSWIAALAAGCWVLSVLAMPLRVDEGVQLMAAAGTLLVLGLLMACWPDTDVVGMAAATVGVCLEVVLAGHRTLGWEPVRLWGLVVAVVTILGVCVPRWVLIRRPSTAHSQARSDAGDLRLDQRWLASDAARMERAEGWWVGALVGVGVVQALASFWLARAGVLGVVLVATCAAVLCLSVRRSGWVVVQGCAAASTLTCVGVLSAEAALNEPTWATAWALGLLVAGALATTQGLVPVQRPETLEALLDGLHYLLLGLLLPLAVLVGGVGRF